MSAGVLALLIVGTALTMFGVVAGYRSSAMADEWEPRSGGPVYGPTRRAIARRWRWLCIGSLLLAVVALLPITVGVVS